jgi:hypothetical protein
MPPASGRRQQEGGDEEGGWGELGFERGRYAKRFTSFWAEFFPCCALSARKLFPAGFDLNEIIILTCAKKKKLT